MSEKDVERLIHSIKEREKGLEKYHESEVRISEIIGKISFLDEEIENLTEKRENLIKSISKEHAEFENELKSVKENINTNLGLIQKSAQKDPESWLSDDDTKIMENYLLSSSENLLKLDDNSRLRIREIMKNLDTRLASSKSGITIDPIPDIGDCHGCKGTCKTGCGLGCKGGCFNSCQGSCMGGCKGGCFNSCQGSCVGGCKDGCMGPIKAGR